MRRDDLPESGNVEDRRGEGGLGRGGGGFGIPMGGGGLSIGTVVILGLLGWALGIDPAPLIGGAEVLTARQPSAGAADRAAHRLAPGRYGPLREPRAWQHRNAMATNLCQGWQVRSGAGSGPLPGRNPCSVRRRGAGRHGTVLLSGPSEDLSRHLVLRSDCDPFPRLRRRQQIVPILTSLRDRTRGRRIMSRT